MVKYVQITEPIAFGTIGEDSPEYMYQRAYANISIKNFNEKWLDFEGSLHEEDDRLVVFLQTLLMHEKDGVPITERVNIGRDSISEFEVGSKSDFSHIWNKYSVEGEHISENRPNFVGRIIDN